MPRPGELTYYDQIGELGRQHALAKPFSDDECGPNLMRLGALFNLLPPPPARILECGCGTGWLAHFLARRGYEVTATDVAADAIRLARGNQIFCQGAVPEFLVADTEALAFDSEFDVVIFFDSLHHCLDEQAALRCAYQALRPGGICVAFEPGWGHQRRSLDVEAEYDVTEKDMPPCYIGRLGRRAGFKNWRVFPAAQHLGKALYTIPRAGSGWLRKALGIWPVPYLVAAGLMLFKRYCGITVLHKDPGEPSRGHGSTHRFMTTAQPNEARAG